MFVHVIIILVPLIVWDNVWIYYGLFVLSGLAIGGAVFTPVIMSYISDTFVKEYRTLAIGLTIVFNGIGVLCGTGLALIVGFVWNIELNIIIISIIFGLTFLYTILFLPESLSVKNRKPLSRETLQNPLKPLCHITSHPIALWISIVQMCASLPEAGVYSIALSVILDQISTQTDYNENTIAAIFIISIGFGSIFGMIILLPILQKYFSDITVMAIGSIISILSFLSMTGIIYSQNILFIVISGTSISVGLISFAAANGLVSKYILPNEQGIGFGVVLSVRQIASVIAPILFGFGYNFFNDLNYPELTFFVASLFGLIELIVIIWPLKRIINHVKITGKQYTFNKSQIIKTNNDGNEINKNLLST